MFRDWIRRTVFKSAGPSLRRFELLKMLEKSVDIAVLSTSPEPSNAFSNSSFGRRILYLKLLRGAAFLNRLEMYPLFSRYPDSVASSNIQ
jgi:hypothetical protein